MDSPFTLNYYSYCWGNPVIFKDCDGYFPNPISAINTFTNNTVSVINEGFEKASNWCSEHKNQIKAVAIGAGAVGLSVAASAIPVVGPVVSGAILSAGMESAAQVWDNGKVTNWTKVGIHAAAGGLTGLIPGAGKLVEKGVTKVASKAVGVGARYIFNSTINGGIAVGLTYADTLADGKKIDKTVNQNALIDFGVTVAFSIIGQGLDDTLIKGIEDKIRMHKNAAEYSKFGRFNVEDVDFLHENRSVYHVPASLSNHFYMQEKSIVSRLTRLLISTNISKSGIEEILQLVISQRLSTLFNEGCGD